MAEATEVEVFKGSKIGAAAMITFGLAALPIMFILSPRMTINSFREGNAVSLSTPDNEAFFETHRKYLATDDTRIEELSRDLKEKMNAQDWIGVADLIKDVDESREALAGSASRLSDIALDYIRYEIADSYGSPNMCNFDYYYVIPDGILAQVEEAFRTHPDNDYLAALLAQIHIDRGWVARGGGWAYEVTEEGWAGLMNSFKTAHDLLRDIDTRARGSSIVARVKFQLMVTQDAEGEALYNTRNAYQDWSDLDVGNPLPHRHFAFFALPRWYGDWDAFEDTATEAAERTRNQLNSAAYARFYLEAFNHDGEDALARMNVSLFKAAVEDLISHDPNPVERAGEVIVALHELTLVEPFTIIGEILFRQKWAKIDALKGVIREIFDKHVTYLPTEKDTYAEKTFVAALDQAYQKELKSGQSIEFTPQGVRALDAS